MSLTKEILSKIENEAKEKAEIKMRDEINHINFLLSHGEEEIKAYAKDISLKKAKEESLNNVNVFPSFIPQDYTEVESISKSIELETESYLENKYETIYQNLIDQKKRFSSMDKDQLVEYLKMVREEEYHNAKLYLKELYMKSSDNTKTYTNKEIVKNIRQTSEQEKIISSNIRNSIYNSKIIKYIKDYTPKNPDSETFLVLLNYLISQDENKISLSEFSLVSNMSISAIGIDGVINIYKTLKSANEGKYITLLDLLGDIISINSVRKRKDSFVTFIDESLNEKEGSYGL